MQAHLALVVPLDVFKDSIASLHIHRHNRVSENGHMGKLLIQDCKNSDMCHNDTKKGVGWIPQCTRHLAILRVQLKSIQKCLARAPVVLTSKSS